jgi:hypothetical protein
MKILFFLFWNYTLCGFRRLHSLVRMKSGSDGTQTFRFSLFAATKAFVFFVPQLERLISKGLIRRGVVDSGYRCRNAQVIWIQLTSGFPSCSDVRGAPE